MAVWEEGMKSPNPSGRGKGRFSPENEMKRARDQSLRNVAAAAASGDVAASIAVLQYFSNEELKARVG